VARLILSRLNAKLGIIKEDMLWLSIDDEKWHNLLMKLMDIDQEVIRQASRKLYKEEFSDDPALTIHRVEKTYY
jgi:hypothetical protein